MALSNGKATGGGPLLFLSPRSKDKNKQDVPPHFEVGRVNAEGKIENDPTLNVTSVSGDLFKMEFKQREYEGTITEEVVFYLRDKSTGESGESYRLPIRFGISGRALFNSFASLAEGTDFSGLQIDYYRNKKGYETFALKQHGEKVSWKYELDALPQPLEIKHPTTGKVLQRDYSAVNEFLKKELVKIADKVNKGTSPSAKTQEPTAPSPTSQGKPDEDVPF